MFGIECSSLVFWDSYRVLVFVLVDWWFKDVSELDIGLYMRVIFVIKVKGVFYELVVESILVYMFKSLLDVYKEFLVGIVVLIIIEELLFRFLELIIISMCWKYLLFCCLWRELIIVFVVFC